MSCDQPDTLLQSLSDELHKLVPEPVTNSLFYHYYANFISRLESLKLSFGSTSYSHHLDSRFVVLELVQLHEHPILLGYKCRNSYVLVTMNRLKSLLPENVLFRLYEECFDLEMYRNLDLDEMKIGYEEDHSFWNAFKKVLDFDDFNNQGGNSAMIVKKCFFKAYKVCRCSRNFEDHVNRIRELPQNKHIIATHTDCPEVLIWDVESQPDRDPVLPAAESVPDLVLAGHVDNVEFALAMFSTEPYVLSGGKDKTVVLWSIHDHISTLSVEESKTTGSIVKHGGNLSIGPHGIFRLHDDTVEDVQFSPSSAQEFCSVGDDKCWILWDARVGLDPVIKVSKTLERETRSQSSPAGLIFKHAGHRHKVVDFHWNVYDPWTIASVSDDVEDSSGGGTLQIWRMNDLIYRPDDEVLAELEQFKSHVIDCNSKPKE